MNMDMARDVCTDLHELAVRVGCGGRRVAGLLEHLARGEEHAVDERRDREHSADDCAGPVRAQIISMVESRIGAKWTHEVRKCANDWRVSEWRMRMGEIS